MGSGSFLMFCWVNRYLFSSTEKLWGPLNFLLFFWEVYRCSGSLGNKLSHLSLAKRMLYMFIEYNIVLNNFQRINWSGNIFFFGGRKFFILSQTPAALTLFRDEFKKIIILNIILAKPIMKKSFLINKSIGIEELLSKTLELALKSESSSPTKADKKNDFSLQK